MSRTLMIATHLWITLAALCAAAQDDPVRLHPLNPPVFKPSGKEFRFWRNETEYAKTYYVDARSPAASDKNPGTAERPFKTIGRASELLHPGERVVVRPGVYRECIRPPRGGTSPWRMIGYHAEPPGKVIVKGSEPVGRKWTRVEGASGLWSLELNRVTFPDDYRPFALENLPEASFDIMSWAQVLRGKLPYTLPRGMVFQEGVRLRRVASREELQKTEGSHWTDRDADRLYLHPRGGKDPNGLLVELTTRRGCFRPCVRGLGFIHVRGFVFEQVGNGFPRPQEGALSVCGGHHWLIEENTVREINAVGIDIGNGWYGGAVRPPEPGEGRAGWTIVRRNRVTQTGACGITGIPGADALIEGNVLEDNTFYPVARIFECAGIKTHMNTGALIRRNVVRRNPFSGIWMDWDNRDARCTQNVVIDCRRGIFIEASVVEPFCVIDRNVIWGGVEGVYEHDSWKQTFVHNLVGGSRSGIVLRGKATKRTVARKYPTAGGGHTVKNNLIVETEQGVQARRDEKWPADAIAANASEKDGVTVRLDKDSLTLTLEVKKPLAEYCGKTLVTHDLFGRPWPKGNRSPGPLPLTVGKVVYRLDRSDR